MTERISAWQCIGCGRIEAPQTCVGICKDLKVEFVYASDYNQLLTNAELVRDQSAAMRALLRQLAGTTPREGCWEQSYRTFQAKARGLLAAYNEASDDLTGHR